MTSNYPPGVSGNEPEIAGYPEATRNVDCNNDDAPHVPVYAMQQCVDEYADLIRQATVRPRNLPQIVDSELARKRWSDRYTALLAEGLLYGECGFNGDVDGIVEGIYFTWTCPRCGVVQTIDLADEAREEMADRQRDRDMEDRL